MTAACASGCTEPSHLETLEYRMRIQVHVADSDHAEITIQIEQILPEDESPMDAMQGQEQSAGSSPPGDPKVACRKRQKSRTPSHGTDRDDQGEMCSSDYLPHGGIGSSRKRPKKQGRQPLAPRRMRRAERAKGALVLENGNKEAEASEEEPPECLVPMPVKIVVFALFLFVIFMRVINGG